MKTAKRRFREKDLFVTVAIHQGKPLAVFSSRNNIDFWLSQQQGKEIEFVDVKAY